MRYAFALLTLLSGPLAAAATCETASDIDGTLAPLESVLGTGQPASCLASVLARQRARLESITGAAGIDARFALRESILQLLGTRSIRPDMRAAVMQAYADATPASPSPAESQADAALWRYAMEEFGAPADAALWYRAVVLAIRAEQRLPAALRSDLLIVQMNQAQPGAGFLDEWIEIAELVKSDAVLRLNVIPRIRERAIYADPEEKAVTTEEVLRRCASLRRLLASLDLLPEERRYDSPGWASLPLSNIARAQFARGLEAEALMTMREAIAVAREGTIDVRLAQLSARLTDVYRMGYPRFDKELLGELARELLELAGDRDSPWARDVRTRVPELMMRAGIGR